MRVGSRRAGRPAYGARRDDPRKEQRDCAAVVRFRATAVVRVRVGSRRAGRPAYGRMAWAMDSKRISTGWCSR